MASITTAQNASSEDCFSMIGLAMATLPRPDGRGSGRHQVPAKRQAHGGWSRSRTPMPRYPRITRPSALLSQVPAAGAATPELLAVGASGSHGVAPGIWDSCAAAHAPAKDRCRLAPVSGD
jgi:hypothetical protein